MASKFAALEAQLLDATQGGDLLRMHRLLLNNEAEGLVNAPLEGGARTALHVAVERSNETAVALLLAHKADATAPDADGKSAVELALDRDAKGILKLLTEPKAVAKRMEEVQALMKREIAGNWAKKRRFSYFGWLLVILTLAVWLLIFVATFIGLAPRAAERVLGKPLLAQLHAAGEQLDEFIRRYQRYRPELKFEPGTPEFVQQIVQSAERERLTRAAEAERAARRGFGEL